MGLCCMGETLMMPLDVPSVPPASPPAILAEAAASSAPPRVDYIFEPCIEIEPTPDDPQSAMRGVDPAQGLKNYLGSPGDPVHIQDVKVKLLQGTQHGKLTVSGFHTVDYSSPDAPTIDGPSVFRYDPNSGYLGDDQAVFLAEYGGKVFKVILTIKVLESVDENRSLRPDGFAPERMYRPKSSDRSADVSGMHTQMGSSLAKHYKFWPR
jgi:hypothetical protein